MATFFRYILKLGLRLPLAILFIIISMSGLGCATTPDTHAQSNHLRVMVWNVLHGANDVTNGAEKALKIIRDTNPDIVMLQESYDINDERPKLGAWLAGELGWNQHQAQSTHLCVLTPLNIETTFFHHAWHGVGAKLRDPMGRELLAWSTWIDYRAYITYALRENPAISDEALLDLERVGSNRLIQATAIIEHLRNAGQIGMHTSPYLFAEEIGIAHRMRLDGRYNTCIQTAKGFAATGKRRDAVCCISSQTRHSGTLSKPRAAPRYHVDPRCSSNKRGSHRALNKNVQCFDFASIGCI